MLCACLEDIHDANMQIANLDMLEHSVTEG